MAKSKGRRLAEWLRNLDSSGTVSNLTSTGIDDNATSTAITIDASENVGIGTASPAEVLHVADTTTAGAVGLRAENSEGHVNFTTNGGGFQFETGASGTVAVIDSSGNVGIGTASPDKRLDVLSGTANSDVAALSGTSTGRGLVISTFDDTGTNADAMVDFDAISGNGQLSFSTGTTERMRISSTGDVGIGTTNPDSLLHLKDPAGTASILRLERSDTTVSTGNGIGIIQFEHKEAGSEGVCAALRVDAGDNSGSGEFVFQTGLADTVTERMRIDSAGNVGIGTTNPIYPLDVVGTLRMQHSGTDTFATIRGPNNRNLRLDIDANGDTDSLTVRDLRDGSDRFTVQAGGNVGIGTASPAKPLHVYSANSGGTTTSLLQNNGGSGTVVELRLAPSLYDNDIGSTARWSAIQAINGGSGNPTSLAFLTNHISADPAERMRIDSSGNVGIGTASAGNLLHIHEGSSAGAWAHFTNTTTSAGGSSGVLVGLDSNEDFRVLQYGAKAVAFYTSTTERMRINSSGNVGIGTTSPTNPLTVQANSGAGAVALNGRSSDGIATLGFYASNGTTAQGYVQGRSDSLRLWAASGDYLSLGSSDTERMRIDSSGNVGIGTESPNEKLNVSGNIRVTSGFVSFSGSISTPSEAAAVYRPSDNTLAFSTANVERMRIDSVGNVGIGTNVPVTYLSNVSGSAKGLAIESAVPVLALKDTSASDDVGYIYQSANSMRFLNFAGGEMTFRRGSSALSSMIIDSSGNVGIGTDSPSSYGYFAVDRGAPASADRTIAAFMAQSTRRMGLVWDDSKSTLGLANLTSQDLCFHIGGIGGASEIMRLQSSGNVGIGTESPVSLLHIEGNAAAGGLTLGRSSSNSAGNVLGVLQFKNEDGSNDGPNVVANIQAVVPNSNGSGGYLTFGTHDGTEGGEGSSPVERMRILSTGGITFNGDTAAANALDDYEEGTWTPVLNGSPTFSSSNQYYVKIGNLVHVGAYIYSVSDYTSATNFTISGLPYATNNARGVGSVMFRDINDTTIAQLNSYISSSSSIMYFYASQNNGGSWDTLEYADGDSGLIDIIFNITYLVS